MSSRRPRARNDGCEKVARGTTCESYKGLNRLLLDWGLKRTGVLWILTRLELRLQISYFYYESIRHVQVMVASERCLSFVAEDHY